MSKSTITRSRVLALSSTAKLLIGLTLFYFIGKSLGRN